MRSGTNAAELIALVELCIVVLYPHSCCVLSIYDVSLSYRCRSFLVFMHEFIYLPTVVVDSTASI